MKTNKKKAVNQPESRSLKIQQKHRSSRYSSSVVPELTLRGKWLEKLGFERDSRVVLETSKGMIVIRPE